MAETIPDHLYHLQEARGMANAARVERREERVAPTAADEQLHAAAKDTYKGLAADAVKKVESDPLARAAFASAGSSPEAVKEMLGGGLLKKAAITLDAVQEQASSYWRNIASQGGQNSRQAERASEAKEEHSSQRAQGLGR